MGGLIIDLAGTAQRSRLHMKVPKCRALLIGYALAAGAFADWPAMQYRITMLADLPGPGLPTCRPEEISDDGTAVGRSFGAAEQGLQAVLWNGTGTVVHLGELPGGNHQSYGYGVNSIGHAAGYCIVSVGGQAVGQAFLWTPQAGMIGLGDLPGSLVDSAGYAINDDDHIVGVSLSSNGNEGFLWTSESGMVGLGDLPGGQFISVPMDINNSDQVVGWSVSDEADEVFIWDAQNGMRSLGHTPTGGIAYTAAINDAGQVAGDLYEPDVGYFSYIWTEADGFLILPGLFGPELRNVPMGHQ